MYQEIYEKYSALFKRNPIDVISDNFMVLAEYDSTQWPEHIPLSNNGTWEEIQQYYSEVQVEQMFSIIYEYLQWKKAQQSKQLKRECLRAMRTTKPYRSDSYEWIINSMLFKQETIITALSKRMDIIFNPVAFTNLEKYEGDWVPLIFTPSPEWYDKYKDIVRKVFYKKSRHIARYEMLKQWWVVRRPYISDLSDIKYININIYWPMIWLSICNNDFNSLYYQP